SALWRISRPARVTPSPRARISVSVTDGTPAVRAETGHLKGMSFQAKTRGFGVCTYDLIQLFALKLHCDTTVAAQKEMIVVLGMRRGATHKGVEPIDSMNQP